MSYGFYHVGYLYIEVENGQVVRLTHNDGADARDEELPAALLKNAAIRQEAERLVVAQAGALTDGYYEATGITADDLNFSALVERAWDDYRSDMRCKVYGALLLAGPMSYEALVSFLEVKAGLGRDYLRALIPDPEPFDDIKTALNELQRAGLVIGDYATDGYKARMADDYSEFAPDVLLDKLADIVAALRAPRGESLADIPF